MDQLVTDQRRVGEEIQLIIRNFKKDSSARKTRAYFERRLQELSSAWDKFDATDSKIRTLENLSTDHPYFRSDYYQEISDIVRQYQELFEKELATIGSKDIDVKTALEPQSRNQSVYPPQIETMIRRQRAIMGTIRRHIASLPQEINSQALNLNIEIMSKLWNQAEELHYSILESADEFEDYDTRSYIEVEGLVRECLSKLAAQQPIHTDQAPVIASSPSVQLPKITIPTFDGDYLKWGQFCDMFTQMVHNQSLPAIQKMWYLKTNVTGEAEKLIRHLPLTENNYNSAWDLMQGRYNNKRVLTSAIISKIMNIPVISTENPSASIIKNLHDTIHEGLLALSNLGVDVSTWDPLLLHILVKKLDRHSHILYEQSITSPREIQTLKAFLNFLEFRFQSLEAIGHKEKSNVARALTSTTPNKNGFSCIVCRQTNHPLYRCKQFLEMSAPNRLLCAQKHKLCVNCFKVGHKAKTCTLRTCTKCDQKHNTLLHLESIAEAADSKLKQNQNQAMKSSSLVANSEHRTHGYVLLGTVKLTVRAQNEQTVSCRALLDSGSQVNLVTERLVKRLGLSPNKSSLQIEGIGRASKCSKLRISLFIQSQITRFSSSIEAHILPEIVSRQPTQHIDISSWTIPPNISLADPTFNQPERVDMILGAELYHQLLFSGQIKLSEGLPILQNTVFGWVVAGRVDQEHLVERFWRIDEVVDSQPALSAADKRCETLFTENTKRSEDGRFVVRLPFLDEPTTLGKSRRTAFNRLCALEKRLSKDPALNEQYKAFVEEYEALGHMSRINSQDIPERHYVIPHHCVLKPDSTSTKLRVVFDASAKTDSGSSLNDILHTGPAVQPELFTILLRFRLPTYVFTADIQKMFRQILLHSEDRPYQLILWREKPSEPTRYYQLNTVTYGTRAAPYLAAKCLQKLAQDNQHRYPLAFVALNEHFYVDDGLVGSNSLAEAIEIQKQLTEVLSQAGFKLRKWCANHQRLLDHIPPEHQEVNLDLEGLHANSIKTLGLIWRPNDDQFLIKVNQNFTSKTTKRTVTLELAKIFDPLGILSPVVVTAKIFIQKLWQLHSSWDDPLPPDLEKTWRSFQDDLSCLQNIHFPRHVFSRQTPKSIQVHVFADASEKAYGAAIYVRSILHDGQVIVRLLCAKSRVAPLKTQTLPRLELCAALLGVQLALRVNKDLKYEAHSTFFWTDSEVVLAWINSSSASFHTFVANRVAKIQEGSLISQWRHVRSADNPADILSRGLPARKFASSNLWFYGPFFLHGKESLWPNPFNKAVDQIPPVEPSELKKKSPETTVAVISEPGSTIYQINHRNSFATLQRVVAYMRRFAQHSKQHGTARATHISLTPVELENALITIIRNIQKDDFKDDLDHLKKHNKIKDGSPLADLTPILDNNGIMRAGGRLENSSLSYDAKHQMLLPYNDPLVKLLMMSIHERNFHCGPQALLAHTRQRFWPIKGKTMARAIVHKCVICCKAKPTLLKQVMGDLPATRVQPARPFINSGVDLCGPFWVHYKIRGKKPHKIYLVVFCCFSTKAVHLELVTDLSTEAFIGSLHRFLGRRGHCANLYCDNATNFVGARNKLMDIKPFIYSEPAQEAIIKACSSKGIHFRFIPPRAPHFGGLWEAAVKSAKHLLMRSFSSASLTYEEFETAIIGVEAVLNSRPICPMSSDPNDLTALTPGHFLIGEPLTAQIDVNAQPSTSGLLRRWELVKHLKLEFWKRWSIEYLNELQRKHKWHEQAVNIEPGMMVILKEDDRPIQDWPLGRIIKTFNGSDGMVRVAEVRTAAGVRTRPIQRLAPLPVESHAEPQESPTQDISENAKNMPGPSRRHSQSEHEEDAERNQSGVEDNSATNPVPRKR